MTYRIVPRTEYGLPAVVTNANGTPRPPLSNEPFITAHYTGNNVDYTGKVTTDVVLQIQNIFGSTKPFEYNYVIGQEDNDEVYEFAGKFQAAHSAGENHLSFGVLFLLGVGEDPTPLMIDKWKWLRDVLIADGSLAPNVDQRMHFQMPGAATACPGNIKNFWPQMLQPWHPIVPPVEESSDMKPIALIRYESHNAVYAQWSGFKTWIPSEGVLGAYKMVYGMDVQVIAAGLTDLLAASGPIVGPIPAGVDGWGRPV